MRQISLSVQSALNIIGSIVAVAINVIINFLLSPYIVAHLGVVVNGYITLANNFVSYIALIFVALNSMAGRFILIEYHKGDQHSANEYFSSVLLGNWILSLLFLIPLTLFVVFINKIIVIPYKYLEDTQILFAIVFINFLMLLCLPQWRTATYCTNNLYLRSINNAVSAIVRAVTIFLLFTLFTPHSYFVAIAACIMSTVSLLIDFGFYKVLMPSLKWKVAYFKIQKVKVLITSGIWNTVSQCGNLLLEGLDILIANLLINPIASGVLALSKVIPNMINQITGTIATTYGPRLTYLFADGDKQGMIREVKNDILYVSIIANLPIGIFIAFGENFFSLWVPSQDSKQLFWLSCYSLLGMLFMGITQCIVNLFGIVNKLRLNSLVVISTGILNILIVYILLKFTNFGIYVITAVSSAVSIIRIFTFTLPYGAKCIDAPRWVFVFPVLKSVLNVMIPITIGYTVTKFFTVNSWISLILHIAITCCFTAIIEYYFVLNDNQRKAILKLLQIKK